MKLKLAFILLLAAPLAHAQPWLCSEPDGTKRFSYEPESAKKKNCVNHPIPSGNVWRVHPSTSARNHEPFPSVDRRTQQRRDVARREILERELAEEKKALAEATRQLAEQRRLAAAARPGAPLEQQLKPLQERVRLHLSNIENLEKELGG